MRTKRFEENVASAAFEPLEARVLLDGVAVGPGGPGGPLAPVLAVVPCERPIIIDILGSTEDFDASPPGGVPVEELCDGRDEEAGSHGPLAGVLPGGVPDERDADVDNDGVGSGPPVGSTGLLGVAGPTEAPDADGDGKLGLNDVKTSSDPGPTSLTFNGRGIDLNGPAPEPPVLPQERPIIEIVLGSTGDYEYTSSRPIIEDILGSTEDFETATAGGPTVEPDERPIIEDILGSTEDFQTGAPGGSEVTPQELPIVMDVLGSTKDFQL